MKDLIKTFFGVIFFVLAVFPLMVVYLFANRSALQRKQDMKFTNADVEKAVVAIESMI